MVELSTTWIIYWCELPSWHVYYSLGESGTTVIYECVGTLIVLVLGVDRECFHGNKICAHYLWRLWTDETRKAVVLLEDR